jgi:hypothetical protein
LEGVQRGNGIQIKVGLYLKEKMLRKISAVKRDALVETLFPDLDRSTVRIVVEAAPTSGCRL